MKKYYIIYAVIGIVFLLCCGVVFLNPNSIYLNMVFHPYQAFERSDASKAGDIAIIVFLVIAALAAVACIVYHLYKFIRRLWLKEHNRRDDEERGVDVPGIELSRKSFKDLPEFSRLHFRAVGEDFEKIIEEEKDKQNRE